MFVPEVNQPEDINEALFLVYQGDQVLLDPRSSDLCLLPRNQVRFLGAEPLQEHFLGFWHGQPCFAREIDQDLSRTDLGLQGGNLYTILGRVSDDLFALAGRGLQILSWDRENRFCGTCGQSMTSHDRERAMTCHPCGTMVYPRIAPCIITLVTRGPEMLLGRNANFPIEMFSTLAGFIEAGESAEECLVREVREEVGVEVENLRYFKSQSWPFPNQLMLGFFADYAGGEINCQDDEIAEAHWFSGDNLPTIPPVHSISGQLIRHHVKHAS